MVLSYSGTSSNVSINRMQHAAGGAWLLISDNHVYEKEMTKPDEMQDVEILGRCQIRIGKIF